MQTNTLTPQQAFEKLKKYCSYQERCHQDVSAKIYSYGCNRADATEIISRLIEENYLNEERYAIQFAGGKFRIKKWGIAKIKFELKKKQVSDYCIKMALKEIETEEYAVTFKNLAEKKLQLLQKEPNIFIRNKKLQTYLLNKGFENTRIMDFIREQKIKNPGG